MNFHKCAPPPENIAIPVVIAGARQCRAPMYHPRAIYWLEGEGAAMRRPELQDRFLGVDVLEWYNPAVHIRQVNKVKGWATHGSK